MPLKWDKKLILAKPEAVYGAEEVLAAADAMLAFDMSFEPKAGQRLERAPVKPTLGPVATPKGAQHTVIGFDVELMGSGTKDAPPKYAALLRACGLAETITATTDVAYDPVSTGEESDTIHFNVDGTLHAMLGVRGTVSVVFEPEVVPKLRFANMLGLDVAPAAVAMPAFDFSGFKDGLVVSKVNTPTFTLHGFAGVLRSCTLNLNQDVVFRDLVGATRVDITGRKPDGEIVIEAPALGTKDFFAISDAGTLAALQIVHGVGDGNVVQIDAPLVQILDPTYEDNDGITYLRMGLNLTEGATGDDELKITTK